MAISSARFLNTLIGTNSSNAFTTSRTADMADSAIILSNITNFQAAVVISAITRSGLTLHFAKFALHSPKLQGDRQVLGGAAYMYHCTLPPRMSCKFHQQKRATIIPPLL